MLNWFEVNGLVKGLFYATNLNIHLHVFVSFHFKIFMTHTEQISLTIVVSIPSLHCLYLKLESPFKLSDIKKISFSNSKHEIKIVRFEY